MFCHAKFSTRGTLSTRIAGWCIAILAVICLAFAYICCASSSEDHITLRKFPYPYKAGLAICSDLDYTDSFEKFIAIQDFLCGARPTELGPGLGLEVGNTFWFYNQFAGTDTLAGDAEDLLYGVEGDWFNRGKGISLFDGVSENLTDYAPGLLKLIEAGFIDCLHSYGDFGDSGFNRELAQRATQLLSRHGLQICTFVNHGDTDNQNNMGEAPWFLGDNPESRFYHADLSCDAGIKYLWRGQVTHCLGQDGRRSKRWLRKTGQVVKVDER